MRMVSVPRVIRASAADIFAVLCDPVRHSDIDGSGTVMRNRNGGGNLVLGSKFGMDMKLGPVPYRINNTVVEFEQDRLIAWAHFGRHRWRYLLEPVETGPGEGPATRVTETFDWSTTFLAKGIELAGYPKRHPANMEASLARLAALVEAPEPAATT